MSPIVKTVLIALGGGLALLLTVVVRGVWRGIAPGLKAGWSKIRADNRVTLGKPAYDALVKTARLYEAAAWVLPEPSGSDDWTRSYAGWAVHYYGKALAACDAEGRPATDRAAAEAGRGRVELLMAQLGQAPVANLWESIRFSRRALDTYTPGSAPEAWGRAQVTLAAALCERDRRAHHDAERAIALCEEVIERLDCRLSRARATLCAQAHCTQAEAHFKRHELELAEKQYRDALALLKPTADRRERARAWCGLGWVILEMARTAAERLAEAEQCFQSAAGLLSVVDAPRELSDAHAGLADVAEYRLQLASEPGGGSVRPTQRALLALGRQKAGVGATARQLRRAELKRGDLYFRRREWERALRAYARAMGADKALFRLSLTGQGRRAFAGQGEPAYRRAAFCQVEMGQAAEALLTLELGKARVLSERLNRERPGWESVQDGEDRQQYRAAVMAHARALERLEAALGAGLTPQEDELTRAVEEAQGELQRVEHRLRNKYPGFLAEVSAGDLARLAADKRMAIVVPVLTGMGGTVLLITVLGGVQAVRLDDFDLPAADALVWKLEDEQAGRWLAAGDARSRDPGGWAGALSEIAARDGDGGLADKLGWMPAYRLHYTVATTARDADAYEITRQWWGAVMRRTMEELYARLWRPILDVLPDTVDRLVVVPQGVLHLVPAGAALAGEGGQAIVDRYAVSYAPSLGVLQKCRQAAVGGPATAPALLAAVGSQAGGPLPYVRFEVDAIAHTWRKWVGTEPQLFVDGATEEAFLQSAAEATYIHYAGHARHDWGDPLQSGLCIESGNALTMDEIQGQGNLSKARLVVLSACETGLVDVESAAEEYVGLPAAFLVAGVPCVVSTLWPVSDQATTALMQAFYGNHLRHGMPFAEALCAAQRSVKQAIYAHPYYWAAFVVSGA
jgi:CHAT domain-containing protein/tetratricopeptide (TPR) repeat protein